MSLRRLPVSCHTRCFAASLAHRFNVEAALRSSGTHFLLDHALHCNTMEGIWTGLRNFLRPFRGVHKEYLAHYVIMFQWSYNLKAVTDVFLRFLIGCSVPTEFVT